MPTRLGRFVVSACALAAISALYGCAVLPDGEPDPIARLVGGEALVQTAGGRIFATGREGVFELQGPGDYRPMLTPLPVPADVPAGCQFTGAASWREWLFALCTTGERSYLLRARASVAAPALSHAAALKGVAIASGLAADDQGRLYVADSRHDATAAITCITGATAPEFAPDTHPWLENTRGGFPSGVQFADGTLFVTSAGRLSAVAVGRDGAPGELQAITTRLTFLDDFHVLPGGGFLLTDYSFNRLLVIDHNGMEHGRFANASKGPTAVLAARRPDGGVLVLITERDGDRLSRIRAPRALRRLMGEP